MSYTRSSESGMYIWSDGNNMHFDDVVVPEDKINVFLAKLNDTRLEELGDRINRGRILLDKTNRGECN